MKIVQIEVAVNMEGNFVTVWRDTPDESWEPSEYENVTPFSLRRAQRAQLTLATWGLATALLSNRVLSKAQMAQLTVVEHKEATK